MNVAVLVLFACVCSVACTHMYTSIVPQTYYREDIDVVACETGNCQCNDSEVDFLFMNVMESEGSGPGASLSGDSCLPGATRINGICQQRD